MSLFQKYLFAVSRCLSCGLKCGGYVCKSCSEKQ